MTALISQPRVGVMVYFYNPSSPEAEGDCQEGEASLGVTLSHRTEIMGTFPRHNCFVCGDGALDFKQSQGNKVLLISVFFFIYVYEWLPMCLYVHKVPVPEMTLDPLKLALQMPASYHTDAENQTQVLWSSARTASAFNH